MKSSLSHFIEHSFDSDKTKDTTAEIKRLAELEETIIIQRNRIANSSSLRLGRAKLRKSTAWLMPSSAFFL